MLIVASNFVVSIHAGVEILQVQWSRTYGQPGEMGESVVQTADGGYMIAGSNSTTYSIGSGYSGYVPLLIKTDPSGEVQWEKAYRSEIGYGFAHAVVQTSDLGYVMFCGGQMVKTDSEGNVQWIKPLGGNFGIQTSAGDYVLLSGSYDSNNALIATLLKTDGEGNVLWNKTFSSVSKGPPSGVAAYSVMETSDKGYAVIGTWEDDCWLAKTDSDGNLLLNRTYHFDFASGQYEGFGIAQTKDDGYVIAGFTTPIPWLAKTDSQGNVQWTHAYADGGTFYSVLQTADGGYFAVGSYNARGWVAVTDSSGGLRWNSTYGDGRGLNPDVANRVVRTSDGGYAVAGTLNNTVWLAKFTLEATTPPAETPTPFSPTWIVVAALVVTSVIAIVGILIFRRRRLKK
jgi:hypothetical protein